MRVVVGVTGASGSIYAERLIKFLLDHIERIYVVSTETGKAVAEHELTLQSEGEGFCLRRLLQGNLTEMEKKYIRVFKCDDLFAPIASGSSCPTAMVVVPCSMGTLARIATGMSTNLLERTADVVLKERKNLVICPRETPLNAIHLENMWRLSKMNAQIVAAMPAFYHRPKTLDELVDFVVGRLVESLGIEHNLYRQWNKRMR